MMLARLGGADEVVVGDLELAPKLLEVRGLAIGPLLRRHAMLGCGLGDLLAMLVHAGQELDVIAGGTAIASLNVGDDGGISRAQVRIGVDVVDGRRDKERRLALIHGVCPPEKRCIQRMILAQGLDILHLLHIEHHGIDIALAARILLRQALGHRRRGLPLLERGADILAQASSGSAAVAPTGTIPASSSSLGGAMTSAISPFTSPRARSSSASWAASPRKTSSCSLVSSRQTATSRWGKTSATASSVATMRCGDS